MHTLQHGSLRHLCAKDMPFCIAKSTTEVREMAALVACWLLRQILAAAVAVAAASDCSRHKLVMLSFC